MNEAEKAGWDVANTGRDLVLIKECKNSKICNDDI